jgi:hypothetical protein
MLSIKRAIAATAGIAALTAGTIGVFADTASAASAGNYGNCIQAGLVEPSDGMNGPQNQTSVISAHRATGAFNAGVQSGWASRFEGFAVCG